MLDSYRLLRPLLFSLPPEFAHAMTLRALQFAYRLGVLSKLNRAPMHDPIALMGLGCPNRLGLAAGLDKNGVYIDALGALGFGFVEIGTVTPRPQAGQPRPRLFRLPQANALINRMGFPNDGATAVAQRLARRTYRGVCGVNIGKNADTPIERAVDDYVAAFRALAPHADYVAINVSSPNTPGLRNLQDRSELEPILAALLDERAQLEKRLARRVPILVKLSPDLSTTELVEAAQLIRDLRIDGVIATNSTVHREGVEQWPIAREQGGLSGPPLQSRSRQTIRRLRAELGTQTAIIGVGGIESSDDAAAMLQAGADLVQIYTGLIYRGPRLVGETLSAISENR